MRQFITLLFSLDPCFILTLSRKLIFKYPGKTGTSCTIRGSGLILYFLLNNWFSIVGMIMMILKNAINSFFATEFISVFFAF